MEQRRGTNRLVVGTRVELLCKCELAFRLVDYDFWTELTAVHACSEIYPGHSSSVVKDACTVAKKHVLFLTSRCEGKQTTITTAAAEPLRPLLLVNQRSLSDELDLSLASAGNVW